MSAINILIFLFSIHLSIISPSSHRFLRSSAAHSPSSSSPPPPPPSSSSPSSNKLSVLMTSPNNEPIRLKRSIEDKWKETNLKSQCEVQCQCASENSSSKRRQPQHEIIGRSLVLAEQQSSLQCKSGVSKVMDGCGCCLVCARQQGDSCNKIHPCDSLKQLFCDSINTDKDGFLNESGICKPKFGEPCIIKGKTYTDGEQFQLNCSLSCSCQNGQYACASLCPQEERPPSSEHCGQAKLLSIAGRCCKEWVCPHPPQHIDVGLYSISHGFPVDHGHFIPGHHPESDSSRKERCIKDVSQWSSCSATCGTGWSIHMTNDNENCKTVVERKMCYMRPCPSDEAQINPNASTWKKCHEGSTLVTLSIEGCTSEKEVNTTICTTCQPTSHNHNTKRRCCRPGQTRTVNIQMKCKNGTSTEMKFKQIKSCRCKETFCRQ